MPYSKLPIVPLAYMCQTCMAFLSSVILNFVDCASVFAFSGKRNLSNGQFIKQGQFKMRFHLSLIHNSKRIKKYEPFYTDGLLWIFYVFVLSCVCYVLCASVYMCFVVTCWERADLLALVCGVFCEFVTFPLVSWVRCGT